MLITKALAEIKMTPSKASKAMAEARQYSYRRGDQVDPLARDGGSSQFVQSRVQSFNALYDDLIQHRKRIRLTNEATQLTIEGSTKSVADWLVWKREVAPNITKELTLLLAGVQLARRGAPQKTTVDQPEPIISHLNERVVMEALTAVQNILSVLDAELSVLNATTECPE